VLFVVVFGSGCGGAVHDLKFNFGLNQKLRILI
jgi:hypothetical protein